VNKNNPDLRPLWVVIPALNEALTIEAVVAGCLALPTVAEVLVIDDGSTDETAARAERSGARVLRHGANRGKGASLVRGMQAALAAGAGSVATLDGDGQHRPEDLVRLAACSQAWPDRIVIGARRLRADTAPRARQIANRIADFWISWAAGHPISDTQSGFRIYPAGLVKALGRGQRMASGFAFESEVLIKAARLGFRTLAVDIPAIYAPDRRASYFRPVRDITAIVLLVAGKLLARGMDPVGLWRSLTQSSPLPLRERMGGSAQEENSHLTPMGVWNQAHCCTGYDRSLRPPAARAGEISARAIRPSRH
jgi:glycosyltransferase involved in cell wall biosynthesis